jgi:hypothetical protein
MQSSTKVRHCFHCFEQIYIESSFNLALIDFAQIESLSSRMFTNTDDFLLEFLYYLPWVKFDQTCPDANKIRLGIRSFA